MSNQTAQKDERVDFSNLTFQEYRELNAQHRHAHYRRLKERNQREGRTEISRRQENA